MIFKQHTKIHEWHCCNAPRMQSNIEEVRQKLKVTLGGSDGRLLFKSFKYVIKVMLTKFSKCLWSFLACLLVWEFRRGWKRLVGRTMAWFRTSGVSGGYLFKRFVGKTRMKNMIMAGWHFKVKKKKWTTADSQLLEGPICCFLIILKGSGVHK